MFFDTEQANITDMQCQVFRMAETKWGISAKECAEIFRKNDVFGFIEECYDTLHLNSYKCALNDVETMLRNRGVMV